MQVFEFLSTDLKKFMDKTGRGPTSRLPTAMVKVSLSNNILQLSACLQQAWLAQSDALWCVTAELYVPARQRGGALPQAWSHAPRPEAAEPAG